MLPIIPEGDSIFLISLQWEWLKRKWEKEDVSNPNTLTSNLKPFSIASQWLSCSSGLCILWTSSFYIQSRCGRSVDIHPYKACLGSQNQLSTPAGQDLESFYGGFQWVQSRMLSRESQQHTVPSSLPPRKWLPAWEPQAECTFQGHRWGKCTSNQPSPTCRSISSHLFFVLSVSSLDITEQDPRGSS